MWDRSNTREDEKKRFLDTAEQQDKGVRKKEENQCHYRGGGEKDLLKKRTGEVAVRRRRRRCVDGTRGQFVEDDLRREREEGGR